MVHLNKQKQKNNAYERKGKVTIMDEKMKEIYDGLSDELKEKARACKTMDELMELAGKEGIELPDEVLDVVAGGCKPRQTGSGIAFR